MVVDLAGVDYISSAGLLALDAVAARVHDAGATWSCVVSLSRCAWLSRSPACSRSSRWSPPATQALARLSEGRAG